MTFNDTRILFSLSQENVNHVKNTPKESVFTQTETFFFCLIIIVWFLMRILKKKKKSLVGGRKQTGGASIDYFSK